MGRLHQDEAGKVGSIEDIGDLFGAFPARGFPASVFKPAWPNQSCHSEAEPRQSWGDSLPHHTPFHPNVPEQEPVENVIAIDAHMNDSQDAIENIWQECEACADLKSKHLQLKNRVQSLQEKLRMGRKELLPLKEKVCNNFVVSLIIIFPYAKLPCVI